MIRLIKNELRKIFKKKTIYILFIITTIVILTNTIVGVSIYEGKMIDYSLEEIKNEREEMQERLKNLDYTNRSQIDEYIETKTKLEIAELSLKYEYGSWQERAISSYEYELQDIIRNINLYTYKNQNKEQLDITKKKYDEVLYLLDKCDWKEFAKFEQKETNNQISKLQESKKNNNQQINKRNNEMSINNTGNPMEITEIINQNSTISIEEQISRYKSKKEILDIRIKEDISYAFSDRNTLLLEYKRTENSFKQMYDNKNYDEMEYAQKIKYNEDLANVKKLEYMLYNKIPTLNKDNSRDMLKNSLKYYEILIITITIIVSVSIISDEINKGTIKLLLIKPFSRGKILLAKFITCIIIMILTVVFILIVQCLAGGIIYGFSDYLVPIMEYDFGTNKVIEVNIVSALITSLIAKLPMYILILAITFGVSTITANTPLSIIIGILLYLSKNLIQVNENMKINKYFLATNWDFTRYLYGALPEAEFLNESFSAILCVIYFIIVIGITFTTFKQKDIRNV